MTTRSDGFAPKKRPGTRAVTNRGQLQNNCPLFVCHVMCNYLSDIATQVAMKIAPCNTMFTEYVPLR